MFHGRTELLRTRGNVFVLSGPSGSGKNTILARLRETVPGLAYSVSATTRSPREGEIHGRDYFFLTREEFVARAEAGEFLETAEFCGNLYGTPRTFIEHRLQAREDVILDIEIRGADQIRQAMPEAVFIFLMPPSLAELRARVDRRGKDSPEAVKRRMQKAVEETQAVVRYDYVVMNSDLESAVDCVRAIIVAERCRVSRWTCESFVQGLREESEKL
ncbi:MAG: guanylate kinase [Firmicutes bacterium]|jgi:guanylate kinase|nr:guanylate kinase [Bacillota bacterium]